MRRVWLLVFVCACAGSKLKAQTHTIDDQIKLARDNGAVRCAPVELAMAESHNDYAEHALDEGNYYDAQGEAEIAEKDPSKRPLDDPPGVAPAKDPGARAVPAKDPDPRAPTPRVAPAKDAP